MLSLNLFAQKKINGKVIGENSQPLSGVTVVNKKSHKTIATSAEGIFSIPANSGDTLEFSIIGYNSKQVRVLNDTLLSVALTIEFLNLNNVVLTGYTSQRVKEITGSVTIVKPSLLTAEPLGQVEQMLQGKVAGLTVITSGDPGVSANIRLHGIGNFGDVTPLYIIDGVQGNINSINPYDIESLQVLKDAAAYSIYGVRGANGVIVITTKKGKPGKTRITYDAYTGVQTPLKKGMDLLNPQEQADLLWLAFKNSGQPPSSPLFGNGSAPVLPDYLFAGPNQTALFDGSPYVADSLYNLDPNKGSIYQIVKFDKKGTDWFHELFKPAWSQNHNLSMSGGSEKSQYLFSFGYLDQDGTLLNTYLKRFTSRINTDFSLFDVIHVGENLQLSYSENSQAARGNGFNTIGDLTTGLNADPSSPLYDIKGAWNPGYGADRGPNDNIVAKRVYAKDNKAKNWQVFGNAYAEVNFLKYFNFKTNFGGNFNYFYNYNFVYGSYDYPNGGYANELTESSGYLSSTTLTNSLSFSKTFPHNQSIKAFAATEMMNSSNRQNSEVAYGLSFNDPNYWLLTNGTFQAQGSNPNSSVASISKLLSFIGRVEYGFNDKYFVTGNLRRDGSSLFGPENRYGWFPSIGAAWRITEEKFMSNLKWLTDVKLRGSWGKTGFYGNTDPANQFTLFGGSASDAFYDINGTSGNGNIQQGYRVVRVGNPKTGWQQDEVIDVGIESILWNGKLNVTADWYRKNSKGLLFQVALPDLLGDVIPPNANVGNILNSGVDLSIGSRGNFTKKWSWDLLLTFTEYKNEILKLNALPYFFDAGDWVKNQVGHPISSFYGYKVIGYFNDDADIAKSPYQPNARPGEFKYLDANKDDSITDADRVFLGNPNPKFTIGFNIGTKFKNFDFSAFFYGSFGNDVLNMFRNNNIFTGGGVSTKTALYNSWSPQHMNAAAPIPEISGNNTSVNNSYVREKGTYFRNKSMIIGYTFPKYHLGSAAIQNLRIYFQVTNLFTITQYSGLDPELADQGSSPLSQGAQRSTFGIDTGNYPDNQKQYLIGINFSL
jgi:TonB-linked SusC/RagA family outer membrane protein